MRVKFLLPIIAASTVVGSVASASADVPVSAAYAASHGRAVTLGGPCTGATRTWVVTSKGIPVWIPSSNSAGPFQFGGQQSLSTADGQLKAVTDGHSNTVGGTVKLPIPVVEASVKYDYQWNHSTTTTTSLTRTFTTISPKMPNDVIWRWRMYFKGYRFIATKWCHVPIPLVNAGDYYTKKQFIVPAAAKQYAFHVEKYSQRGWLVKMDGSTIKPWNN